MPNGQPTAHEIELIVDNYCVHGELAISGGARRLVDILNAAEDLVSVRDAELSYPLAGERDPTKAPLAHVHLDTILFALPYGADVRYEDPFEIVKKVPIPCVVVVPGFEIAGNIHMVAEVDPNEPQILTSLHFVPLTDARVVALANPAKVWEADICVVNLRRAVVYAPRAAIAATVA